MSEPYSIEELVCTKFFFFFLPDIPTFLLLLGSSDWRGIYSRFSFIEFSILCLFPFLWLKQPELLDPWLLLCFLKLILAWSLAPSGVLEFICLNLSSKTMLSLFDFTREGRGRKGIFLNPRNLKTLVQLILLLWFLSNSIFLFCFKRLAGDCLEPRNSIFALFWEQE